MSTTKRIREIVIADLHYAGSPSDLTDDYPLIDKQVIDSLDMVRLVSIIEETFGIEVGDEDLVPDNFATIAKIAQFVDQHPHT